MADLTLTLMLMLTRARAGGSTEPGGGKPRKLVDGAGGGRAGAAGTGGMAGEAPVGIAGGDR